MELLAQSTLANPSATFLGQSASVVMLLTVLAFLAAAFGGWKGRSDSKLLGFSEKAFWTGCAGLFFGFVVLIFLFVTHQFQFEYVANHSALDSEVHFLVAGVWSGQEGSFLLWAIASAVFGLLTLRKTGEVRPWYTVIYGTFLAGLAGILSYESPFRMMPKDVIVQNGAGMPPSLMNYWVVIHPPIIFLGFGSLTVVFAWSMAAMLHKNLDDWIKPVRPWSLIGLALLGVGLCMGGFWAYETLGWGGFWKWDPVENTSFVPWLALAAFVHGIFVQLAKNKWKLANAVLAGLPFVLFCYGTFLTRSGFLGDTSVHSFAEMDRSALWLLTGIGTLAAGSLAFVAFQANKWLIKSEPGRAADFPLNRESLYAWGIWLLVFFGLTTGIGMSVPLIQSLAGQKPKMVEEHLYHQILAWPFPLIAILMAVAPFVSWRGLSARELAGKLVNVLALTVGTAGFLLLWVKWAGQEILLGSTAIRIPGNAADPTKTIEFFKGFSPNNTAWIVILAGICLFGIYANAARAISLFKKSKLGIGGFLTHVGVFVTLLGLIVSRGFEQHAFVTVHPSMPPEKREAFGYVIGLEGKTSEYTDRNNKIRLSVTGQNEKFEANPGLYFVPGQGGTPLANKIPAIISHPLYDLYFVVHEFSFEGAFTDLTQGESARFNDIVVTYDKFRSEGPLGMAGATFYADVTIHTPTGEIKASPYFKVTDTPGQPEQPEIPITDHYTIKLAGLDAATKSAKIEVNFRTEAFPVEVYYKPLTGCVWWGVGIMTLGGLVAAWSRRYRPTSPESPAESTTGTEPEVEQEDDAPEPVSQV